MCKYCGKVATKPQNIYKHFSFKQLYTYNWENERSAINIAHN